MRIVIILATLLLAAGCSDQAELQRASDEMFNLKKDLLKANEQVSAQKTEIESLRAQIPQYEAEKQTMQNSNTELQAQLARLTSDLSAVSNQYEKLKSAILKQRQATYSAQLEAQRKREATLKNIEANRPEGYPFRLFNVQFVGKWRVGDVTAEHGRFSIRNYTDKELNILAIAGRPDGNNSFVSMNGQLVWRVPIVRLSIPANSSKENIYIQANKDTRIIVQSNVGTKTVTWGETK